MVEAEKKIGTGTDHREVLPPSEGIPEGQPSGGTAGRIPEVVVEIPEGEPSSPISDEQRAILDQLGAEEALEKHALPPIREADRAIQPQAPEAHRARYNLRVLIRRTVAGLGSLATIAVSLYAASGRWLKGVQEGKRVSDFAGSWARALRDPSQVGQCEEALKTLFNSHLTPNIDLNNGKTWTGAFREGAVGLRDAINTILNQTGQGWNQLEERLINSGMKQQFADLIEELWKEGQTGNGNVRDAFEAIKELSKSVPRLLQALRLDRIIDSETLNEIARTIPSDYDPEKISFAVKSMVSPGDYSEAALAGRATGFMLTLAIAYLAGENVPKLGKWAKRQMRILVEKVPSLKEFIKF